MHGADEPRTCRGWSRRFGCLLYRPLRSVSLSFETGFSFAVAIMAMVVAAVAWVVAVLMLVVLVELLSLEIPSRSDRSDRVDLLDRSELIERFQPRRAMLRLTSFLFRLGACGGPAISLSDGAS